MQESNKITKHNLSEALQDTQSKCIGLFKSIYDKSWELVLEAEKQEDLKPDANSHMLITLSIGNLFGLRINHISSDAGMFVRFPKGRTLSEMLEEPFEFDYWYKSLP